jgi:hypothetical protein
LRLAEYTSRGRRARSRGRWAERSASCSLFKDIAWSLTRVVGRHGRFMSWCLRDVSRNNSCGGQQSSEQAHVHPALTRGVTVTREQFLRCALKLTKPVKRHDQGSRRREDGYSTGHATTQERDRSRRTKALSAPFEVAKAGDRNPSPTRPAWGANSRAEGHGGPISAFQARSKRADAEEQGRLAKV